MSKSLGNSPDLLELIDQYGADAVRFGILIASPAGNDLLFDDSSLEQGKHFNNKLWNALKLVKMWEGKQGTGNDEQGTVDASRQPSTVNHPPSNSAFAVNWFGQRLQQVRAEVDELMKQFRLSEALKTLYSLIWDDFCSWYLEWVKPGFEQPIDANVYRKTVEYFEQLMQLLHPFMPFITEEIYHALRPQEQDLCVSQYAPAAATDAAILAQGELLKKVITQLRDARNKNQLKPKEAVTLHIETNEVNAYIAICDILSRQVNAKEIFFTATPISGTIVVAVEKDKFYLEAEKALDQTALKADLLKDLAHQQQFLQSVMKKLGNEKFVQNAKPEVIALEQKKKADAEDRIRTIEESLASLG